MVGTPIHLAAFSGTSILAHQGGWDEILLVAGPILVIVVALRIVKRRVEANAAAMADATAAGESIEPTTAGESIEPTDDSKSIEPTDDVGTR